MKKLSIFSVVIINLFIGCNPTAEQVLHTSVNNRFYGIQVNENLYTEIFEEKSSKKEVLFMAKRDPKIPSSSLEEQKKYFDLKIYSPIELEPGLAPIKALCNSSRTELKKEEQVDKGYYLFEYRAPQCGESRKYGIVRNNKIYSVIAGQDTGDYNALWDVLKNLTFTDETKSDK